MFYQGLNIFDLSRKAKSLKKRSVRVAIALLTIYGTPITVSAQLHSPSGESANASMTSAPSDVQASLRVIKEAVPNTKPHEYFRKAASETPSGFPVPRYVSLKFGKVNGRTGPSRDHSIAWQYRRRGLPLVIVAETEMWRKVRDINGDEAWVRRPALSGERFVLTRAETTLLSKPKLGSKVIAATDSGALLKLEECNESGWCRVTSGNGIRGWTSNRHLWGADTL
ncbi:SH3-like domain-containing protein [Litorimonas taeanensis]|uniref:SH3-like domain-containing protein n=1 Tax=Litorimonas taeanensis TaxID=568099 RepID=A0A420WDI0_9PROT|nr:SH3 domain-containing protein [Litorimonas taeanensis]RKQ69046.1 SH3-like domain-containing protein [Litorimonas taeanensis]